MSIFYQFIVWFFTFLKSLFLSRSFNNLNVVEPINLFFLKLVLLVYYLRNPTLPQGQKDIHLHFFSKSFKGSLLTFIFLEILFLDSPVLLGLFSSFCSVLVNTYNPGTHVFLHCWKTLSNCCFEYCFSIYTSNFSLQSS